MNNMAQPEKLEMAAPSPLTGQSPHRRFGARTILVPLLFMALHFVFSNFIVAVYLIVYLAVRVSGGSLDLMATLQDQGAMNQIIYGNYPFIAVLIALGLIPACLVFLRLQNRRDPRTWLVERLRTSDILPALAMMIGALGVTNLWYNLLILLQEQIPLLKYWMDDYTKSASAFTADNGYFWLILGISILTPISEELIFRGVIQGELRRAMPEWAAIVIQAVLFAAYHMQPIQSSYVLLPGLLLGLAYYWSRSIWVPIAMHCLFNFLGSALPSLIGESKLGQEILGYSEMGFILIGAAAAVFFMLHRRRPAASDLGEMKI
jgi:membrane protease YdiL (CAAX protease family)